MPVVNFIALCHLYLHVQGEKKGSLEEYYSYQELANTHPGVQNTYSSISQNMVKVSCNLSS